MLRVNRKPWYHPPTDPMGGVYQAIVSAAKSAQRLSTGELGDRMVCEVCQLERETVEYGNGRYKIRIWSDCDCVRAEIDRVEQVKTLAADRGRRAAAEHIMAQLGLMRAAQFRLESFDRDRLQTPAGGAHPYDYALRWVEGVRGTSTANYTMGPPAALYFYSAGKGRGKTHMAAALAWLAYEWGYLAGFVEETSYLSGYYAANFDDREQMQALIGDQCWITVIDDMGQTPPGRGSTGTSKAWFDVINRRWLRRGWTVITSNRTLPELLAQGTINDAAYSRLYQMTRGQMVMFEGADYRIASHS